MKHKRLVVGLVAVTIVFCLASFVFTLLAIWSEGDTSNLSDTVALLLTSAFVTGFAAVFASIE